MSKVIRVEEKDGEGSVTVEISDEPPPPPDGWKRSGCLVSGDDACIVEDLLVRGFDEHKVPTILIVDGKTRCRVCSQERKPRKDT